MNLQYNELNEEADFIGFENWGSYEVGGEMLFGPQNPWMSNPFSDVTESKYFYKAVQYVYYNNIMDSTSNTLFYPNNNLTRGELASIVYHMAGAPSVSGFANPFGDVSSNSEYLSAIKWVYNNGNQSIMNGTSSTTFKPNDPVSREMAVVVLDRYATRTGIELHEFRDYTPFEDNNNISNWAKNSVQNLYKACIINGKGEVFEPKSNIKRCDVAILIRRLEVIHEYL